MTLKQAIAKLTPAQKKVVSLLSQGWTAWEPKDGVESWHIASQGIEERFARVATVQPLDDAGIIIPDGFSYRLSTETEYAWIQAFI